MRFRVAINSILSQKAIFLNSEFFRDSLIPYNIVCIRDPFLIIIRFLHILIYHRNEHVKVNVFYYFPFSFRVGDKMNLKQVLPFIEDNLYHSCMPESLHMKFQAKIYRSDRIRIYSPRHHDNRSGSQDTPYIPCQF